jgi:uncharacterized protein YyaL (SSP411 family)
MEHTTYSDPAVIKLIQDKFIAVKVDEDSRPDLSNKYGDYGWPATVAFDSSGKEKHIWDGYVAPKKFLADLQAILKNKNIGGVTTQPISRFVQSGQMSESLRKELEKKHIDGYDTENGAWSFGQKFLEWDSVEYAMKKALAGDATSEKRAKQTLLAQRKLIDPIWGGVYQYSTDNDWDHPHFEKIMQMQAENLRTYSQAYMQWHDPIFLKTALDIERYLRNFLLSPEGAFYTSQDADLIQGKHSADYFKLDDFERRKRGVPRIDKHIYARENGWAINALVYLYAATGDSKYLDEATQATGWIIANRGLPTGGFKHDAIDQGGPYLGDTLYMGRAFLTLYMATADRKWLEYAEHAANFIGTHFTLPSGGFLTSDLSRHSIPAPEPLLDENVYMARFANLLFQYTGDKKYRTLAEQAMHYIATPEIAKQRHSFVAGMLLADDELNSDPSHVTVVGSKSDPDALKLFNTAIEFPLSYKKIEWLDRKEGLLPGMDIEFPDLPKAAAFVCTNGACSYPIYDPSGIVGKLLGKKQTLH